MIVRGPTSGGAAGTRPVRFQRDLRDENGAALLIAVLLLLAISAIGVAALGHSGADLQNASRMRVFTRAFHAADAGIQAAVEQLEREPTDLSPFRYSLSNDTIVRSGPRTASSARPLEFVAVAAPPSGYSLEIGSGFRNHVYRASATGIANSDSAVELEVRISTLGHSGGAY